MKHVVSVSLGASSRDHKVSLEFAGHKVLVERVGTDGDTKKATEIFAELDGKIDAFGLGGADLGMMFKERYYPFHSIKHIADSVSKTPLTDGEGLKRVLESRVATVLESELRSYLDQVGRKTLLVNAVSRWGMAESFSQAGHKCTYGDLMFSLGLPIPVYSLKLITVFARVLGPIVTRLPFSWLYPYENATGSHKPKFTKHFRKASVIAGDCKYISDAIPLGLDGKVIVTNTTTESDITLFKKCGIKYVVSSTPVYNQRSFGTNVLEAIIIALAEEKEALDLMELQRWIDKLGIVPQIRQLY